MKPQGPSPEAGDPALAYARQLTLIAYLLHAVTSATAISLFVAVFINYSRRDRVRGTIYESHFEWQITTFWYVLAFFIVGTGMIFWGSIAWVSLKGRGGVGLVVLGILLLFVLWCWHLYRVIRGLMRWNDRRPMPD